LQIMLGYRFRKGCWFALNEMGKSRASALGVDWTCSPRNARYLSGGNIHYKEILIHQDYCLHRLLRKWCTND
jgi:uroporphyrinogen-III decarboxylase